MDKRHYLHTQLIQLIYHQYKINVNNGLLLSFLSLASIHAVTSLIVGQLESYVLESCMFIDFPH